MKKIISVAVLLIAIPFAFSQGSQGSQGSTPASQAGGVERININPAGPLPAEYKVKPGKCHTNGDGVEVCNTSSNATRVITINPKNGSASSATVVEAKNDAEGTVKGIDANDTVYCAHGSNVTIEGTGGTVVPASGSTGSVKNTNPAGGANITIKFPGSGSVQVPPGVTIPFQG